VSTDHDTGERGERGERVEQTLVLVRTLIETLPPRAKEQFLQEILLAAPHGEVLRKVVQFLSTRKDFTIAELKQQISASPKEIYNAVGYLTRKQHIRRVGYGRYRRGDI